MSDREEEETGDCETCPNRAACLKRTAFFKEKLVEVNEEDPKEINLRIIEAVDVFLEDPTTAKREAVAVLVKQAKAENRVELEAEKAELRQIISDVLHDSRAG